MIPKLMRTSCLVLGLAALGACGPAPAPLPDGVQRVSAARANEILSAHVDAVNAYRASNGVAPVTLSAQLTAAARTHARDMSVQERAWHFGSDGSSPRDRAERAGFAGRVVGENISESFDDEIAVLQSWINDLVTRRVLLAREADQIGLGFHQDPDGKLWWVQMFGASGAAPTPTLVALPPFGAAG